MKIPFTTVARFRLLVPALLLTTSCRLLADDPRSRTVAGNQDDVESVADVMTSPAATAVAGDNHADSPSGTSFFATPPGWIGNRAANTAPTFSAQTRAGRSGLLSAAAKATVQRIAAKGAAVNGALPLAAGGTLMVDVAYGNSPYAITANDLYQYVDVGETGVGVVNHTAGTLTVTSTLTLGNQTGSNGTYNLSGTGAINTSLEFIGNNGAGAFVQSGTTTNTVTSFLALGSDGGASTYTLNGGALVVSSGTATAASESIGQVGAATFTQAGGTHTVNATGTFTLGDDAAGTYALNGGTLTIPKVTRNTGASTFNFNGGILQANAASTTFLTGLTVANVQVGGAKIDTNGFAITIGQALIADTTSTGGALTKSGAGTLTLTGTNTYTGGTMFAGGTLNVGSAAALNNSGTLSFTGGTLQYGGANTTDYSGRFSAVAGQAYSVDTNGQIVTFATGLASSGGSLTKLGGGTLLLNAANTYSGATTVGAGTLSVNNNVTSTSGRLTNTSAINISGTLLLAGSAAVNDRLNNAATVTLNGGGTFSTGALNEGAAPASAGVGGAAGVGALTLAGTTSSLRAAIDFGSTQTGSALVFTSLAASGKGAFVSILNFTGAQRTDNGLATNDRLLFTSDPGFTVADLANWQFSNDAGTPYATGGLEIAYNTYFEIVPVPEPGTWLGGGLLLGIAGTTMPRWRRVV